MSTNFPSKFPFSPGIPKLLVVSVHHLLRVACFLFLFACCLVTANAKGAGHPFSPHNFLPPGKVIGKVTDAKNAPLEGVSVTIKGTRRGVTTNAAGVFSITNVPENATLVFSYTGFILKEMPVKGDQEINVSLVELVVGLNDVVVVGYGTRTKKDLTGAVSQIKATQLENENPKNVADMLRGNAPGLDVGFDGSTKGNSSSLQIRGKGTLTAGSSPLIVLDGVIYPGDLSNINPNDIATLDILKDASSAAVYGAQSANGVIIISTKKGKAGKPVITFNDNFGINKVQNKPHFLDPYEFVNWRQDVIWAFNGFDSTSKPGVQYKFINPTKLPSSISVAQWQALDGSTGDPTVTWLTRLRMRPIEITNYQAGKSLDWQKLIYNQHAYQQDHTVSISQRRDDYNYYFSLGYLDNQGLTVGDRFKTVRARLNLEASIAKYLTVGVNFQFSDRDESSVPVSLADMIQTTPWGSYYADDGKTLRVSPNDDPGNNTHPFLGQAYTSRLYKYDDFFANVFAKGKLPWGFSYQVNFTPRLELLREYNYQSAQNPQIAARNGIIDRRNQTIYSWLNDNIINWNGKFGRHNIEATVLINAEKFQQWNTLLHAENLAPNGNLGYNSVQSATLPPVVSSDDQYSTGDALMGRINYNYNQRYFLTVTERRDGYSAFGQQNPRAYFPSVALSWAFSEEKFMKNTSGWLDYGKLRLSYGKNGNRSIGRYQALSNLAAGTYVFVTSGGTAYNVAQISASNLANPTLKWERQGGINAGIDFSVVKGIVTGSVDYYSRTTNDLLVSRSLPTVTGFANVLTNLGELSNKGLEITFNTKNLKRKNFEWNSSVSVWFNKNKIVHLYGPTPDYDATGKQTGTSEKDDITNGWFIGHDINAIYDYKVTGVWQTADAALAKTYGFKPGDFRLQDANGDGAYTIADKQFIGRTTPSFSWSLRNEFKIYQNFAFSFTLYAKMGQLSQFNEAKNVDHFYDRSEFFQRPYWTPSNPINDYAALNSNAGGPVSWNVYRKSSFVRVSNVSLAYSVSQKMVQKWGIGGLKLYVNVVNAKVFSSWNYFDPEYHGINTSNLPTNNSPVPVTINFGLNLTL
jgi:TonB-dependent starch-binding outer membrane protein SusC